MTICDCVNEMLWQSFTVRMTIVLHRDTIGK